MCKMSVRHRSDWTERVIRPPLAFMALVAVLALVPHAPTGAEALIHPIVRGLNAPVGVAQPRDGSERLFVVLQQGQILIVEKGESLPNPFLDIEEQVLWKAEAGLLSVAFHPDYARNGRFFIDYVDRGQHTVVAEYRVSEDTNRADPSSARTLLRFEQPTFIMNGGQLQFGPDGFLYIGTGDGGSFGRGEGEDSAGDPGNHAQDTHSLLGKILRIDVDLGDPYAIPEDNPFRDGVGGRPEVWAFGLRNPWRFSFDRENGDLFIGDVGETRREEIDRLPREVEAPANLGWRLMEGGLCFKPATGCHDRKTTVPLLEYSHYEGCAVIGGYRYRGSSYPKARGLYLFADFCKGEIRGAEPDPQGNWTWRPVGRSPSRVTSFGEDQEGELYITAFGEDGGILGRLELTNQPFQPETAPPDPLSIFE
jgi:glucose/arabinose dehydrogenase